MVVEVTPEDEYQHTPMMDPLWWENYHFNSYDPEEKMGVTIYTAIKPLSGFRESIVTLYPGNPLFFRNLEKLREDALASECLKMKPLQCLKKWKICLKDSFQKTENSVPLHDVEDVEFDLCFESDMPPYRYSTEGGYRYEQPGSLIGEVKIGDNTVDFCGYGIRDHSWGIRNIPAWGEYYALMGRFGSGVISCSYLNTGDSQFFYGWIRTDKCFRIETIQVDPVFSGNVLETCHMTIGTSEDTLEIQSHLISYMTIEMGKEQDNIIALEILMELKVDGTPGHGFLWCRGQNR